MDSARLRQEMKDLKLCERIVNTLSSDGPQRVVLIGKSGIGKTRLARKVGEHATQKYCCYMTLCLHLNKRFDDELSLYENIAFQIQVYDGDDKWEKEDLLKTLKEKIHAELKTRKESAEYRTLDKFLRNVNRASYSWMKPYLLLILDDEGNKTSESTVMNELGLESFLKEYAPRKVLITRRKGDEYTIRHEGEIQETDHEDEIKSYVTTNPYSQIQFCTTDESRALLVTLTDHNMRDLFESLISDETREFLESLQVAWKIDEPLISRVAKKSLSLPAAIVVLAKSLNCITELKSLSPGQNKVLKEALHICEPGHSDFGYNPILRLAYQLLETDGNAAVKDAMVDCFWHSLDFFKHSGCVYYSDLITQWILEGYFDPVRSVKKAYTDGHCILLELIERGILTIQEGDMVVPEMSVDSLIDLRHHGLLGRSRLQFATVYGGDKKKGLGKITQIDDMIITVRGENIRTILVSGNRMRRETPKEFFEQPHMKDLEVVGLFYPTMEYLIQSLRELKKLRVLVIRDYNLLPSIEELKDLRKLEVLEVSGASSLEAISDEFFKAMPQLQILNLSGLQIYGSPSSISLLRNLRCLILRDCPVLKNFPGINHLEKLEVVDVRGARMLRTCFGMRENSRSNRTFSRLPQLQILDFSETKILRLPIFHDGAMVTKLHSLTRLSLHNCSDLIKLPNLKPLSGLKILDLSGTTNLVEIAAVCFEQKEELKILNLSGTKLSRLPFTISGLCNLTQLLLSDNTNIEALPNIDRLTSLEVLDVSGCSKLHKIVGSFTDMSYLRQVNLSGTLIETIPALPERSIICCSKIIVLADSRRLIHDTWSQVKEAIKNGMSESLSSSDTVDRVQEISKQESGRMDLLWAFDYSEEKGGRREHLHQRPIYRVLYMKTIPFVDDKTCQQILEIQGVNDVAQDKETLAKAEFVAFVDNSASSLSSIFNDLKSVKGCWLEMCAEIKILFSDVDEESLGSLETLSLRNLPRLESICSRTFKNLKKLSLDCCMSIKTLFPPSQEPTNLEILDIKFCEKLEKVFEAEVELRQLHILYLFELPVLTTIGAKVPNLDRYKEIKCPQLKTSKETVRGASRRLDSV